MGYKVITAPSSEPITLDEARSQLRIEAFGSPSSHPDDTFIQGLISAAREFCENYTEIALVSQTIEFALDSFPDGAIVPPFSPIVSITSIKYFDEYDVEQTLSNTVYTFDEYETSSQIYLKPNQVWPYSNGQTNNVKVRCVVGMAACPASIKAAIKLIVGSLYENRQEDLLANTRLSFNSLPTGVKSLLQPYRIRMGM